MKIVKSHRSKLRTKLFLLLISTFQIPLRKKIEFVISSLLTVAVPAESSIPRLLLSLSPINPLFPIFGGGINPILSRSIPESAIGIFLGISLLLPN
jgi:hypothetical protein